MRETLPATVVELIRKEVAEEAKNGDHARAVKALAALCEKHRKRKLATPRRGRREAATLALGEVGNVYVREKLRAALNQTSKPDNQSTRGS